jgi:hypothetical protein
MSSRITIRSFTLLHQWRWIHCLVAMSTSFARINRQSRYSVDIDMWLWYCRSCLQWNNIGRIHMWTKHSYSRSNIILNRRSTIIDDVYSLGLAISLQSKTFTTEISMSTRCACRVRLQSIGYRTNQWCHATSICDARLWHLGIERWSLVDNNQEKISFAHQF